MESRGNIHNVIEQDNSLGRMYTTLAQCSITSPTFYKQVVCNIQELCKVASPSAMAISMAFHLPHIMPYSV